MNLPPHNSIEKIYPQATEFYRLFDQAYKMIEDNDIADAISTLEAAVKDDPDDSLGHFMLGTALSANDQESGLAGISCGSSAFAKESEVPRPPGDVALLE